MTNPYRALCAELTATLEYIWNGLRSKDMQELLDRAHALLDQPEPVQPDVVHPFVVRHYTDDERPSIKGNGFDGLEIGEDRQEAEEFITWINERFRALALLVEPRLEELTDDELDKSFQQWWYEEGSIGPFGLDHEEHTRFISKIAWHNGAYIARLDRDTSQPVWDDIHYAWELHDDEGEWQAGGSAITLESAEREGNRYLQTYAQDGPHKLIIERHCVNIIEEMANG